MYNNIELYYSSTYNYVTSNYVSNYITNYINNIIRIKIILFKYIFFY